MSLVVGLALLMKSDIVSPARSVLSATSSATGGTTPFRFPALIDCLFLFFPSVYIVHAVSFSHNSDVHILDCCEVVTYFHKT